VEAAGIEPASRNNPVKVSTYLFSFLISLHKLHEAGFWKARLLEISSPPPIAKKKETIPYFGALLNPIGKD